MKNLKTFEELNPSTYRELRDRTADYPWSKYAARTPELKDRADKMGRVNKLSGERFEQEFFNKFPKGTKITVCDSENPNNKVELELDELMWKANWTYYTLAFKQKNSPFYRGNMDMFVRFQGDTAMRGTGDAYTMDPAHKLGFKGEIKVYDGSKQLLNSMFQLGRDIEPEVEESPKESPLKEKPKGFISKIRDWMK
jgi:hypothetical protein